MLSTVREQVEAQLNHKAGTIFGATCLGSTGSPYSDSRLATRLAVRESGVGRSDNVKALTAVAKLSAGLRLCARELALVIAKGTLAPDIVEHISVVSNAIPDLLSRRFGP